jgi:hypothetical protein
MKHELVGDDGLGVLVVDVVNVVFFARQDVG